MCYWARHKKKQTISPVEPPVGHRTNAQRYPKASPYSPETGGKNKIKYHKWCCKLDTTSGKSSLTRDDGGELQKRKTLRFAGQSRNKSLHMETQEGQMTTAAWLQGARKRIDTQRTEHMLKTFEGSKCATTSATLGGGTNDCVRSS